MFTFIYLNILAPLKCETDRFKQSTGYTGRGAQSSGWCQVWAIFTTFLQEEEGDAFVPQNGKVVI